MDQEMNNPLENRRYALELVRCVFRRYYLKYCFADLHSAPYSKIKQRFTPAIKKAVKRLVPSFRNFDRNTFICNGDSDEMRFQQASNYLFRYLFRDGFSEKMFLVFCIHIAKLATSSFMNGFESAPSIAADVIADAMDYFYANMDLKEDSWIELDKRTRRIVKRGLK